MRTDSKFNPYRTDVPGMPPPRRQAVTTRVRGRGSPVRREQLRGQATRERLLKVAEQLFVRHGYDAVGVERIVRAAAVTKGAFYHHFPDKLAVFRAVFEKIDREMAERVMEGAAATATPDTPLAMVRAGMRTCFALCAQPRYGRLVYVEAPAVLGWTLWHDIDSAIAGELVVTGLQAAVDRGELAPASMTALTTLLLGAIMQSGITIANSADPLATGRMLADEVDRVLLALQAAAAGRPTGKHRDA